uniref:AlNc14C27G2658 protein n=1 Tax=Albugo laibachii Nc14 TaxID=890382 RepID=F0W729_9STRA|nr:AlNc14C27G2658 [Albugo laibachii Nc14]|eukprot:CCA16928.1 AlNc14C27G2658 [Albugo laibachii Nc14]
MVVAPISTRTHFELCQRNAGYSCQNSKREGLARECFLNKVSILVPVHASIQMMYL